MCGAGIMGSWHLRFILPFIVYGSSKLSCKNCQPCIHTHTHTHTCTHTSFLDFLPVFSWCNKLAQTYIIKPHKCIILLFYRQNLDRCLPGHALRENPSPWHFQVLETFPHSVAQEYWSGQPIPSPGDLPDPDIEPGSPALQADSLPLRY